MPSIIPSGMSRLRDVNSPQYGQITGARPARINQLGMKLLW